MVVMVLLTWHSLSIPYNIHIITYIWVSFARNGFFLQRNIYFWRAPKSYSLERFTESNSIQYCPLSGDWHHEGELLTPMAEHLQGPRHLAALQDGNLPSVIFLIFFLKLAATKRSELALISQLFLKISILNIARRRRKKNNLKKYFLG